MLLNEKQKQKIKEIAEKYQLRLILLFGSQATGEIHNESDFDIAYLPAKNLEFEQENYLNYEFTNFFQNDRVDTVDMRKAPPLLFYAIFRRCLILFKENDLVFPTYRAYAFKKYIEAKPFLEKSFEKK